MTSQEQPGIEIRPFAAADFPTVRALYRKVWRGEVRDERYDRMRFVGGINGATVASVAMDGARCVGFFMLWPMTLTDGSRAVAAGQAMDVLTDPDCQGRGIFPRLAKATCDTAARGGVQVLFAAPNAASYPGFMRRLSWAHPCEVITYVRPLSFSGAVPLGAALTPVARLLPLAGEAGVEKREEAPDGEALAALLAAIPAERGLWRVCRTTQWYAFRYQPAGKFDYRWVSVYRDGALAGLAIWGLPLASDRRLVRANLVELVGLDAAAAARRRGRCRQGGARRRSACDHGDDNRETARRATPLERVLALSERPSGHAHSRFRVVRRQPLRRRKLGPFRR